MKKLFAFTAIALTAACANGAYGEKEASVEKESAMVEVSALDAVLAAQSDDAKARYQYRNPKETLEFFGIEPDMTVVDTLPGDVWYAGILSDYLGSEGRVVGANFSLDHRAAMGGRYASEEYRTKNLNWPQDWSTERNAERGENDAPYSAFFYGSFPDEMQGSADAVLMVRAVHHLMRIGDGEFFAEAVADINAVLKPGGIVGVVQHRAPETASDEWAKGGAGYVKQSAVIAAFEGAGFELVDSSEINANPKDQPTEEDFVWRLPPSLGTSRDDAELREKMIAIGESDRMTLMFRKPE